MVQIEQVDTRSKAAAGRFLQVPSHLYHGHPLWVPPLLMDAAAQLNKQKHLFYERADAEFFLALHAGFRHADLTQVTESAVEMRSDLETLGAFPYKNHCVFFRDL